jgi:hypothetical protein
VPVVVGLLGVGSTDLVSRLGHSFRVQRLLRGRIPEVEDVVAGVTLLCVVVSTVVASVAMPVVVSTVVAGVPVPVVVSTVVAGVAKFEVLLACLQYSNPSLGRFRGVGVVLVENITEDIDEVGVPVEAAVVEVFFEVEVFVEVDEVVLVEVDEVVLVEVDEDALVEVDEVVLVEVDEVVLVEVDEDALVEVDEVVLVEVDEVVLVEVDEDALEAGASKSTL